MQGHIGMATWIWHSWKVILKKSLKNSTWISLPLGVLNFLRLILIWVLPPETFWFYIRGFPCCSWFPCGISQLQWPFLSTSHCRELISPLVPLSFLPQSSQRFLGADLSPIPSEQVLFCLFVLLVALMSTFILVIFTYCFLWFLFFDWHSFWLTCF